MIATGSLPVVRARIACANAGEYRRVRAAEFAARGVLIRSQRVRPIGARVRLKIELLDGTFGHDGEAVVAEHVRSGQPGYVLKLVGPSALSGASFTPGRTAPAAPRDREGAAGADLAAFLFSDLNLPESASAPLELADVVPPPPAEPRLAALPPPRLARAARVDDAPVPGCDPVEAWARAEARAMAAGFPADLDGLGDASQMPPGGPAFQRTGLLGRLRGARHVGPIMAAIALGAAVGAGGLVLVAGPSRAEARAADFAAELRRADERLRSGRLAAPGNDTALDHLVAARALVPDDPRLGKRLKLLAEVFGELGERALARGDLEEAVAHFQAKLRADPASEAARERLRELGARTAPAPVARGARAGARR